MEVVLADGRIVHLGTPCVKDVAGYSMKDVFIGSEGTLGGQVGKFICVGLNSRIMLASPALPCQKSRSYS